MHAPCSGLITFVLFAVFLRSLHTFWQPLVCPGFQARIKKIMRTDKEVGKVAAPVPAVIYILYCGVEVPAQWAQLVSCAHVLFGHFLESIGFARVCRAKPNQRCVLYCVTLSLCHVVLA